MKPEISIEGVEEAKALLEKIAPKEAFNIMRATVHGMAGEIGKQAREFAPEREGTLIRNIKWQRRRVKDGKIRSDVIVGRQAFYWRFLEYGTSKLAEQAYFAAAIEVFRGKMTDLFLRQFVKKFIAALKRARKRQGI